MDRKNLWIAGGLIGIIIFAFIIVSIGFIFISVGSGLVSEIINPFPEYNIENASFNNSTPELTAVSIARLNFGSNFNEVIVDDVYLTDDGNYWIVDIDYGGGKDRFVDVTIDAKTWMSKNSDYNEWRSVDELKASYITAIQLDFHTEKPQKIIMDGKEIWKVPVDTYHSYKNGTEIFEYVYVDLATGKSKNTLDEFNKAAGTDGWLTLKQVNDVINKGDYKPDSLINIKQIPFRNALRDLYPE